MVRAVGAVAGRDPEEDAPAAGDSGAGKQRQARIVASASGEIPQISSRPRLATGSCT